jgi:hypothetical protein
MKTKFDIEFYQTNGCALGCIIKSPAGSTARAFWMGLDNRLSNYKAGANIHFESRNLRLSKNLVDQMIKSGREFVEARKAVDPEFSLTKI